MLYQPRELTEALRIKADLGSAATVLAGGTDLIVLLNRGQWHPQNILDLSRVDALREIGQPDGSFRMGAGATHTEISALPVPALSQACLSIGGAQIRNRGTLAGNMATASPAGDGCVALLALDATLEISHAGRGVRQVPARKFFLDYKRTELQDDELITAISVPADWSSAWYKIGKRGSVNISVVCCAIGRAPEGRYCVAFGSVGPYPLYTPKTEKLLTDNPLTPALIEQAADLVQTEVSPIDDHRASANYRRAMCGVLLRRLLTENFLPARRT